MWKAEHGFYLGMNDAHDLLWAPDGSCLAVWEGPLEYKLQIYTPLGTLRATFLIEPDPTPACQSHGQVLLLSLDRRQSGARKQPI